MIGDDVIITVVDIRGDKVRLGIEAPRAIPVHRSEVYHSLRRSLAEQDGREYKEVEIPLSEFTKPQSPSISADPNNLSE